MGDDWNDQPVGELWTVEPLPEGGVTYPSYPYTHKIKVDKDLLGPYLDQLKQDNLLASIEMVRFQSTPGMKSHQEWHDYQAVCIKQAEMDHVQEVMSFFLLPEPDVRWVEAFEDWAHNLVKENIEAWRGRGVECNKCDMQAGILTGWFVL